MERKPAYPSAARQQQQRQYGSKQADDWVGDAEKKDTDQLAGSSRNSTLDTDDVAYIAPFDDQIRQNLDQTFSRVDSLVSRGMSVWVDGVSAGNATYARSSLDRGSSDSRRRDNGEKVVEETGGVGSESASPNGHPEDVEVVYPKAWALFALTAGLCLATFAVALDNTILATAIPHITDQFHSLGDVGWYGSSYLLTTTSLQPSFGKIYAQFSLKYTYIVALIIFEVGSVVCAAAVNSQMLIVGRAIAGCGAAALFSGGMTIVGHAVPLDKRAIYIALLSSMFGISSVVGPLLGGAFTDRATWRWCFWINLPFGGVAIATVFFFFKPPKRKIAPEPLKTKLGRIDLVGAGLLICAITCLLLALQWGGSTYPWSDSKVWGCILGFGLIISLFLAWQLYRGELATIPPRILRQRTVAACALFSFFLSMGLYTHIYYLPFYFQAVKGTTAEQSGIRTIPYLLSNILASIVVGGTVTWLGYYTPFTWLGSAIFVVGCGLIYTLKVSSGPGMWIGYQILCGIGAGSCVQIPFIAVQAVVSGPDLPVGNAVAIFFNTLGGALAVSVAQNIFSNGLETFIPKCTTGVDAQVVLAAGATRVRDVVPPSQLQGALTAYDAALENVFIMPIAVVGLAVLSSALFEWKNVKGKKLEMAAG